MAFTSLNHEMDEEWMRYAYECTRKDGAVGVDRQSAQEYALNLEQNLRSLLDRLKSGRYRAPPVRRHYIDKPDGGQRGLGIPCFEDKVAQRAIAMLLEPIFEQDFLECSYGFRPGRNAHQALRALHMGIMKRGGYWVLEVDIRKYFDSIPIAQLRAFLKQRVTDGVVRRMIDKWLKAGVMEQGQVSYPKAGTPQGGVISPLLSNVFLHEVLDVWFTREVQPRLEERSTLIRYCDDFVMLFACRKDAERVQAVLAKRLGRFGLQLHPQKTRLLDLRPEKAKEAHIRQEAPLVFLGFQHLWGKSLRGTWVVRQYTAKHRLARALKAINEVCRRRRHEPLPQQHQRLSWMLKGHYAYFGITGNHKQLNCLYRATRRRWRKWLSRRGSKGRLSWEKFAQQIEQRFPLPIPKIIHRYAT
jgi:RNA-directed DNA polymerase